MLRQIYKIPEAKLKEPKNVQWLSLYEAVSAVFKSFGSIVGALEHIAEEKTLFEFSESKRQTKGNQR